MTDYEGVTRFVNGALGEKEARENFYEGVCAQTYQAGVTVMAHPAFRDVRSVYTETVDGEELQYAQTPFVELDKGIKVAIRERLFDGLPARTYVGEAAIVEFELVAKLGDDDQALFATVSGEPHSVIEFSDSAKKHVKVANSTSSSHGMIHEEVRSAFRAVWDGVIKPATEVVAQPVTA
ncbi:MAG: hypothetical protein AAB436_03845 [Patescibacteria group bacterium]